MNKETSIKLFEQKQIRSTWDEEKEKWYFSIVDVVGILSESIDPQVYWRKLKQRLKEEGNCGLQKLPANGLMKLKTRKLA